MTVIRTALAEAFHQLVHVKTRGQKLDRLGRMVARNVLTLEAKEVGVKYNSAWKKREKKVKAESAVMMEKKETGVMA